MSYYGYQTPYDCGFNQTNGGAINHSSIETTTTTWQCYNMYQCCLYDECYFKWQRCDGYKNCGDGSDERDCPPRTAQPLSTAYSSLVFFAFFLVCAVLLYKYCMYTNKRARNNTTRDTETSARNNHTISANREGADIINSHNDLEFLDEYNHVSTPFPLSNRGFTPGPGFSTCTGGLPPKYEDIDFSKSCPVGTLPDSPTPPPYDAQANTRTEPGDNRGTASTATSCDVSRRIQNASSQCSTAHSAISCSPISSLTPTMDNTHAHIGSDIDNESQSAQQNTADGERQRRSNDQDNTTTANVVIEVNVPAATMNSRPKPQK